MGLLEIRATEDWDRSHFAMSDKELEIHEALVAIERLLGREGVAKETRHALELAIEALRRPRS